MAPVSIHKSKKNKKPIIATPELSNPPESAPISSDTPSGPLTSSSSSTAKTEETGKSSDSTSNGKLNLSEPSVPAPSPGAEKAPSSEPDEPPTVNIYPTVSTTPPAGSASATNANPSPVPPSTHHP